MKHLILFILGSMIGSFLQVVFSRRDWYKGRSRCDSCGYMLKWYDLIPVLSYVCIGGRCRKCKAKIRPTHLFSELLMGGTFVCVSLCYNNYEMFSAAIVITGLIFMSVCAIEDMVEKKIYTFLLYGGILVTDIIKIIMVSMEKGDFAAFDYMVSVAAVKISLWMISKLSNAEIGAGDFDIIILMYIICGGMGCMYSVFYASFIGCIIYLPLILLKKFDRRTPIPFVPLLLIGTVCNIMFGVMNF